MRGVLLAVVGGAASSEMPRLPAEVRPLAGSAGHSMHGVLLAVV